MTSLAETCAELATLAPGLAPALPRDNTGHVPHTQTHGSVPVNPDVMYAGIILITEIPLAAQRACEATGERWVKRDLYVCLRALPRLAQRLTALGQPQGATDLEDAARWWVRVTKAALGLRTPDIPLGYPCPVHDGPPAILLAAGSEGFLRRTREGLTVEWVHAGRVFCPSCGASWGPGEWLHLGRVLQDTA